MAIYLIRHTTPLVAEGTCYGQTDLQVGLTFLEEAEKIQQPKGVDRIYTSPLDRCMRLARRLWPDRAVQAVDALKEMHFGDWEGKPWSDIDRSVLDAWMQDFVHTPVPGGESYALLQQRVVSWWEQTARPQAMADRTQTTVRDPDNTSAGANTAIVTHAGVIRSLLCHCTGAPLASSFDAFPVPFGAVYRLEEENGRWAARLL